MSLKSSLLKVLPTILLTTCLFLDINALLLANHFEEIALNKKGNGTYRWWGIKIYDAALYVPNQFDGNYLETRPIGLEIEYDIDIEKDDLIESTVDEWNDLKMTENGECDDKLQWSKNLHGIWPNLVQGDRLTLIVDSEQQSLFLHNGVEVGVVSGKSFANCFLSIWLAKDTNAPSLRRKLLGIQRKR